MRSLLKSKTQKFWEIVIEKDDIFDKKLNKNLTLACAPLIPPSPEVRKTFPAKDSNPRYLRPALRTVNWKRRHFFSKSILHKNWEELVVNVDMVVRQSK